MSLRGHFYSQLRTLLSVSIRIYAPVLILLAAIVVVSFRYDVPIGNFTRDPAAVIGANPFIGVISNVGILFWCATAAICFFCAALLRRERYENGLPSFFSASGLVTGTLLLDDLFMLHESAFEYLHIHEVITYSGYLTIVLLFLIAFRKSIIETEFVLLLLAFCFFGLSLIIDFFQDRVPSHSLFEDGCKLLGIVSWFTYFVRTCFQNMDPGKLANKRVADMREQDDVL